MTEKKKLQARKTVAENRKARHEYFLEEFFESGIVLTGTEVKSLRAGRANIAESYASIENGEAWLINSNITEYKMGNRFNHEPKRHRKLLLKAKEIKRMLGATQRGGMTLIPLELFFNEKGYVKLSLALAKGKKLHDKRETEKSKDWQRQQQRLMKNN